MFPHIIQHYLSKVISHLLCCYFMPHWHFFQHIAVTSSPHGLVLLTGRLWVHVSVLYTMQNLLYSSMMCQHLHMDPFWWIRLTSWDVALCKPVFIALYLFWLFFFRLFPFPQTSVELEVSFKGQLSLKYTFLSLFCYWTKCVLIIKVLIIFRYCIIS